MRDAFVRGADLQKAFAVFGPVIGLSAVLGPIVGGAIAANAFGSGWRLIFLVNLPLGLIAAVGAARVHARVAPAQDRRARPRRHAARRAGRWGC